VLKALDLHKKKDNYPLQLSGGEQQRAALARALVKEPVILLADEPTGNLDFETTQNIMSVIKDINAQGTTIILATHNRDLVEMVPRRVLHIERGVMKE
jgi:cell division transport system ATP-binding protein